MGWRIGSGSAADMLTVKLTIGLAIGLTIGLMRDSEIGLSVYLLTDPIQSLSRTWDDVLL